MIQLKTVALLGLVAVSLCACNTDNPRGTVELAYARLMKSDSRGFAKLLTGPAKARYSSIQKQAELQSRLEGRALFVTEVIETASTREMDLHRVIVRASNSAETARVLELTVECRAVAPSVTSGRFPGNSGTEWYSGMSCKIREIL